MHNHNVLVILLAYNEEESVGAVIDSVRSAGGYDILVVDDGSSDRTAQAARQQGVFVVSHPFNLGIGASFQTGCLFARSKGYSTIARMDADGQHSAQSLPGLIDAVSAEGADIAIGSRFIGRTGFKSSFMRRLGISLISGVLWMVTGRKVTDPTSGFCAMKRNAFEFFSENCADDYPEPQILLYHEDFRIKEVPVLMMHRTKGTSSISWHKTLYYMLKVMLALIAVDPQRGKR